MFNHKWNACHIECIKEYNSAAVNKIHWKLETSTNNIFNYSHTQYGSITTVQDYTELSAMTAEEAINLVKSNLGLEVDELEQRGIQQIENVVVPTVEFTPTAEMLMALVPPEEPINDSIGGV